MRKLKNKTMAIMIAAILTISMGTSMILLPSTNAHTPAWQIPTYAFVNVAPNPAGLGQTVTVGMWLQIPPPTAMAATGDRWHNFKLTITSPDGTTQTLGPFTSDDTGGTYTTFTPNLLGNYSFVFSFPGQTLTGENGGFGAYVGDYFKPSTSETAYCTVQQEAIPYIPTVPLPTSYWTRPVQSGNGLWANITGNWLGLGAHSFANTGRYNNTGNYNPYSEAPLAAHILWTKPVAFGGLVGGEFGGTDTSNYYSTSQYEPKWAPIIINGVMYYVTYPNSYTTPGGWAAVDIRTGQTLWTKNTTDILRCGQLLQMVNPNQFGSTAYLWANPLLVNPFNLGTGPSVNGAIWNMYDAQTGNFILSIVNGTSMTLTEDDSGNLIGYYVNSTIPTAPTLNMWNSTQAILYPNSQFVLGTTVANWNWRPLQNQVIDFKRGIQWTAPLPTNISNVPLPQTLAINSVNSGVVLMTAIPSPDVSGTFNTGFGIEAGFNSVTGTQLWITNRTLDAFARDQITKVGYGLEVRIDATTGAIRAYSLNTGLLAWGPINLSGDNGNFPVPNPYNTIGGYQTELANGVLYVSGFGGDVWALDVTNGKQLWYTNTNTLIGESGSDTPYGVWPLWVFSGGSISGNGVYLLNVGHEYSPPLFRGAQQLALNTTDGSLIWKIMGFDVTNAAPIVDGVAMVLNAYDNQLYAYSQGPSKLTVAAPSVGVTTSTPISITGTVTDISAGTQQQAQAANFPNGLPCVSDASQSAWMEYVYMQQPCPNDVTGVPISISVLDSNGNFRQIGSTTSDGSGGFRFTWKPDIPGDFTVVASFDGSESYYPSSAEAFFTATEPASTPSPQPTQPASLADQYILPGIIGIIVTIVIVGVVLALLMLRKKP
jgi:PQQ-like domain